MEEAGRLDIFDDRYDELLASAHAWEVQASELMKTGIGQRPTLKQVQAQVENEEWLAGLALRKLSPVLRINAGRFTAWATSGTYTVSTADLADGCEPARVFQPNPRMS